MNKNRTVKGEFYEFSDLTQKITIKRRFTPKGQRTQKPMK
jgi:hypothetical protein